MMEKVGAVLDSHAAHWASIYPDAPDAIRARIKSAAEKSSIIAQVELEEALTMPNGGNADMLTAMAEADGDVRHMVLLLTESKSSSGCFLSAFPFAAGAIAHEVTIEDLQCDGSGTEGLIRGRTEDGAELSFFDALFFKNCGDYEVGESYQFALSAFAYSLRPQGLKLVHGGDLTTAHPLDMLRPARNGSPDDYEYRATVQHAYPMRFCGGTLWRMRVTVARKRPEHGGRGALRRGTRSSPRISAKTGRRDYGALVAAGLFGGRLGHNRTKAPAVDKIEILRVEKYLRSLFRLGHHSH